MADKLTQHQRGFLLPITRDYARVERPLRSRDVGSPSTCDHLVRKGWLTRETVYGPRGGRTYLYTPTADALALLDRVDGPYRGAKAHVNEYFLKHHDVVDAHLYASVEGFRPGYRGNEYHEVSKTLVFTPEGLRRAESLGYTAFGIKVPSKRHGVHVTADFSVGELKRAAEVPA